MVAQVFNSDNLPFLMKSGDVISVNTYAPVKLYAITCLQLREYRADIALCTTITMRQYDINNVMLLPNRFYTVIGNAIAYPQFVDFHLERTFQ